MNFTLSVALLVSIVLTTFYTIGVPKSPILVDQLCVYQGRHYEQSEFDAEYARQLINQIPDDASVCASMRFVPHLVFRTGIHDFYAVGDRVKTDYVLITDSYLEKTRGDHVLFYYRDNYELLSTDGTVYLFHLIQP